MFSQKKNFCLFNSLFKGADSLSALVRILMSPYHRLLLTALTAPLGFLERSRFAARFLYTKAVSYVSRCVLNALEHRIRYLGRTSCVCVRLNFFPSFFLPDTLRDSLPFSSMLIRLICTPE